MGAVIIGSLLAAVVAAGSYALVPIEVRSSLTGIVLEEGLVAVGATVVEGRPLVYVRVPLTGMKAVAVAAPTDGVVSEVLVRPGQRVVPGDVLVRLMPR